MTDNLKNVLNLPQIKFWVELDKIYQNLFFLYLVFRKKSGKTLGLNIIKRQMIVNILIFKCMVLIVEVHFFAVDNNNNTNRMRK